MTPAEIISGARIVLNDTDATAYRYSDADLLTYVNDAVKSAATLRSDWFTSIVSVACTAGQCEQTVSVANAHALLDVISITGGSALRPFDFAAMSLFNPAWLTDTAGAATHWTKLPGDALRFFVYPKAPVAQSVSVRYVRVPTEYALGDTITDLPETTMAALIDYVIGMAESRDDEHVISQRATQFLNQFATRIAGVKG